MRETFGKENRAGGMGKEKSGNKAGRNCGNNAGNGVDTEKCGNKAGTMREQSGNNAGANCGNPQCGFAFYVSRFLLPLCSRIF